MLPALGVDELRVVERMVERLMKFRAEYGELKLPDHRDFSHEAALELQDALFYMCAQAVVDDDRRLESLRAEAALELAEITAPRDRVGG